MDNMGLPETHVPNVQAYLRKNNDIYICSMSKLRGLAWDETEPFIRTTLLQDVELLGASLVEAKLGSLNYFDRENYNQFIPPYFEWAGVKTHSQFSKNTKSVQIKFLPECIEYSPLRLERSVWYGMPDHEVQIAASSTQEEIGRQLLESFEAAIA